MLSFGSFGAQICIVGRTDFASEAGTLVAGLAEALARSFPVAFLPTDAEGDSVTLPSGRVLPVCRNTRAIIVSVVCEPQSEPGNDIEPPGHLRYAWMSSADPVPAGHVAWLNAQFDAVLVPGVDLADALRRGGVTRPVLPVPAPLDLDAPSLGPSPVVSRLAALIDPSIAAFRGIAIDPAIIRLTETRLGRRADVIGGMRRQICAAHDGGFFSVFNTYLSHLAWQQREDRCHAVLPDWDVERFLGRLEAPVRSFCYGQPGDGNLWSKLFQPLFGATDVEMNDPRFLYRHAELPADRHNEAREPTMTYVRAYTLYRSPDFAAFRRQYHRVFIQHVRLRPEHQAEIDVFAAAHLTAPILIAAHVRHPSHTVEQPTGRIAGTDLYIEQVRDVVRRRGGDPAGPGWAVFVATDQERVLHRFRAAFGERAVFFPDARRTRADEDASFDALTPTEQNKDGHQLQHLVAADHAGWSWRMAWEVVRDAYAMARCGTLLHVVSNVSTAVAYMNPEIEMVFCEP
ncbi:MAG: hypothetical protein ACRYF2_09775 [Janthinobacterium lividum]